MIDHNVGSTSTTAQLVAWQGEFGRAYTDRNVVDWRDRLPAFGHILEGLEVCSVLEVGCNRGHNLVALTQVLGSGAEIVGVEPCPYALDQARSAGDSIRVLPGNILDLPFADGSFDLVFTCGVLIHIALSDLPRALAELHRVSRRFLMAGEYFAETETTIHYRGHDDMLWKRNFPEHFEKQFDDLSMIRSGLWKWGDDDTQWWLFQKEGS